MLGLKTFGCRFYFRIIQPTTSLHMASIKRKVQKLKWLLVIVCVSFAYFFWLRLHHLKSWTDELKDEKAMLRNQRETGNVEERNRIRISRIKQTCNLIGNVTQIPASRRPIVRAIMNPNHDITYCRVNKVASTYTVDMLATTFNCSEDCMRDATKKVYDLPYTNMRHVIAQSYKFTFVREPYGRLFSTYSNKFYFPKPYWAPIGPAIVKRYRETPSNDSLIYGHDITFYEMIRFIVEEYEAGRRVDEHFRPMNYNCFPCDYQYDFIGKLETMVSDWTYLRDVWSRKRHIPIPPKTAGQIVSRKFPSLVYIPKTLKLIQNSTISVYKLYLRAWAYYQMTGYIYKHVNMPFDENSVIVLDKFKHALNEAAEKSKPYALEMKLQKNEALKQAYASIPIQLLERLTKIFIIDCLLYEYDNKPGWLFDREIKQIDFNFFKGFG